jgi:toxin ParE1/3/4
MRLRWLRGARRDVRQIGRYIAQDSVAAAERVTTHIVEAVDLLIDQLGMGRPGRVIGTRELVISGTPYIAAYRVRGESTVEVIAVLHGAQQWPESFEDRLPSPHRPKS